MSIKNSAELKGLETRRNKLQAERKTLNIEIAEKQKESAAMKKKIDYLQSAIEKLKKKTPSNIVISEHAMLRYIERVLGIDLNELQNKIIPSNKLDEIKLIGNGTFSINNHKVTVKDGVVVTVIGDNNV